MGDVPFGFEPAAQAVGQRRQNEIGVLAGGVRAVAPWSQAWIESQLSHPFCSPQEAAVANRSAKDIHRSQIARESMPAISAALPVGVARSNGEDVIAGMGVEPAGYLLQNAGWIPAIIVRESNDLANRGTQA